MPIGKADTVHAKTKQLKDDGRMVCELYMKEQQMVIQQERMITQKVETAHEMCKRALRAEQAQKEAKEEKDTSISMKAECHAKIVRPHDGTAAVGTPHSRPQVKSNQLKSKYWFDEQEKREELLTLQKVSKR